MFYRSVLNAKTVKIKLQKNRRNYYKILLHIRIYLDLNQTPFTYAHSKLTFHFAFSNINTKKAIKSISSIFLYFSMLSPTERQRSLSSAAHFLYNKFKYFLSIFLNKKKMFYDDVPSIIKSEKSLEIAEFLWMVTGPACHSNSFLSTEIKCI